MDKTLTDLKPLEEKGIPAEEGIRSWKELTSFKYSVNEVHPYTRCRIIAMNGAEYEAFWFGHHMARHVDDIETKQKLCMVRRMEHQQQKALGGIIPGDENNLEHTLGYEQVAVDLTAGLAELEKDENVKAALDFALLEDFDHLYRYSNFLDMHNPSGRSVEDIIGKYTEVMPGRTTFIEHRHPFDEIKKSYDASSADFSTIMHAMTIVAAEQQTMNYYANVANRFESDLLRALYTEIGTIEEQHVSHYESLLDPSSSWAQMLCCHEYNECWLYWSLAQEEEDPKVKKLFEHHLEMELGHLQSAIQVLKKMDKKDPEEFLSKEFPEPISFHSNVDYVRDVISKSTDLTADGQGYSSIEEFSKDHRFFSYNNAINKGMSPSTEVVKRRIEKRGEDFRLTVNGEHPLERFRDRKSVPEK
jgi:rubrerythrin